MIRLLLAAIKQIEIDERKELNDSEVLAVLDKQLKQRRDSIAQFEQAGRDDLVAHERQQMQVIQSFMPQALNQDELQAFIQAAITQTQAASMADMGKVMAQVKPLIQGRADMALASQMVKSALA